MLVRESFFALEASMTATPLPLLDATLATRDVLRYRVYAHTTLPATEVQVEVTVTVLAVSPYRDQCATEARALAALADFIATDWAMAPADRPDLGSEPHVRVFRACARTGPVALGDLAARARRAAREDLHLGELEIAPVADDVALTRAALVLRSRTLGEIGRHIAAFGQCTGRVWRVAGLTFGADATTYARLRPSGTALDGTTPDPALTSGERIVLVTEVVLSAEPPILH
jgi:hypothetical protein